MRRSILLLVLLACPACLAPDGGWANGAKRVGRSFELGVARGWSESILQEDVAPGRGDREGSGWALTGSFHPLAFFWSEDIRLEWPESPPPWMRDEHVKPAVKDKGDQHADPPEKPGWWRDFSSVEAILTKLLGGLMTLAMLVFGHRVVKGKGEPAAEEGP